MTTSLLIAGGGMIAVATAMAVVRRQREAAARRDLARRLGWTVVPISAQDWGERLQCAALMRIGHSRQFLAGFQSREGVLLLAYSCETGFEHRRNRHRWRVAVVELEHGLARAAYTRQDWLLATTAAPVAHEFPLCDDPTGDPGSPKLTAVVEDREAWAGRLSGGVRDWLIRQPQERTWEILPGMIVGYEPGAFLEARVGDLAAAARELAVLLTGEGHSSPAA